jgi:hypothetical protein
MIFQLALQVCSSDLTSRLTDGSPSAMDDFISDCTDVPLSELTHIHTSANERAKPAT